MIAAIEWIPAGRANPNPSKYEYSRAEREFLVRMQEQAGGDGEANDDDDDYDVGADAAREEKNAAAGGGGAGSGSDDDWEDVADEDVAGKVDDEDEEEEGGKGGGGGRGGRRDDDNEKTIDPSRLRLPKIDPSSLPADLRMDEYSDDDDDDDDDGVGEKNVGVLLGVGKDAEMMMEAAFDDNDDKNDVAGDDYESSDSEDEDNLDDVPDTREYMPLDVEGLQSLGIGGSGGGSGGKMHGKDGGYTMEDLQNMTMNVQDGDDDDDDDDEEDEDDIQLRDSDALIVVAKTEEDFASLEVNIFDARSSNLYVHHDIPLPSYPLCLALGCVVSSDNNSGTARAGNYVAVGSFEPHIEVWNLDVMNALEPTLVLGGMDTRGAEEDWMRIHQVTKPSSTTIGSGKMQKKNKKTKNGAGGGGGKGGTGLRDGSHTDAVMGLSWNTVHRQVLASASADCTVKLWDVTQTHGDYIRPSATLTHHTDKVQSLEWHPTEGTLLATGGYDRRVCLVDARSAAAVSTANNANQSVKTAKLLADCEALAWDPHNQQYLTAASEDGTVQCWDVRKFGSDPVWSFVAHDYGGVSDITYNAQIPGMFITCSIDKTVALWDTQSSTSPTPQPCGSKNMSVGKLYSVSCYPSSPWLLACGGSGNELAIWDMEGEDAIRNRFAGRVHGGEGPLATDSNEEEKQPDFEAIMAAGDSYGATIKALEGMEKSKKKKGKKQNKAHKRK